MSATVLLQRALERLAYHAENRHGGYCESQSTNEIAEAIRIYLAKVKALKAKVKP